MRGRFVLVGCLLAMALGAVPEAHATSAVTDATANPPAFVPNWDGESDATVIRYLIAERSSVIVRILDSRGRIVATIDAGVRSAGTHLVSWDGRGNDGRVQQAGAYRVRIDAAPRRLTNPGLPGTATMGGVVTAGARAATITLQQPPVTVRGVRLTRASIGRKGVASRTSLRFDLSTSASISAAIVDGSGHAVRTLASGSMHAGTNTLPWDGRATSGAALADGDYALLVAASGAGRPTATTRVPLHVDRTLPTLRAATSLRARVSSGGVVVPLTVSTSELGTLTAQVGRRSARRSLTVGTNALAIPGAELGIVATARPRTIPVRVLVVDAAGNAVARSVRVVVPAAARAVTRPVPTPPHLPTTTTQPPVAGRLPWPVDGVVTSEFGLRGGRPHTGLDIAAPAGTPIHPIAPGTVTYVGALGGYGNVVWVDSAGGLRTYYAHMSRFGGYGVGDAVTHLDVIGYVGCTGHCSGPHVHFETRIADVPRDPRAYLTSR